MKFFFHSPLFAEATDGGSATGPQGDPLINASQRTGDIKLGGEGLKLEPSQAGIVKEAEKPAEGAKPAEAAKAADTPTGWTFDQFMKNLGSDFKEGDPRFNQFKPVKDFTEKTIKANEALALKEIELGSKLAAKEKELAAALAKPGGAVPADVTAIQAQLNDITTKFTETQSKLAEYEAKGKLEGHPAFKRDFDASQAAIFRTAKETGDAIKLPQDKLDEIFSLRGQLAITKGINALGDIDPDAKGILMARALEWDSLQAKRDDLLNGKTGKTPSQLLAEYEAEQSHYGIQLANNFSKELTGKLITSTDGVADKLAKDYPLFGTEHGKMLEHGVKLEFQSGKIPTADEVVSSMMLAKVAPVWQKAATDALAKVATLEAQVARLTAHMPKGDAATGDPSTTNRMVQNANNGFSDPSLRTADIKLTR